jgi:cobalt/nickel transport system permease protein
VANRTKYENIIKNCVPNKCLYIASYIRQRILFNKLLSSERRVNPLSMNKIDKSNIPEWLLAMDDAEYKGKSHHGIHFLKKTLSHISEVFENEFFCEKYAGKPLLLQTIDPRVKLITLIFYLILSSFTSNIFLLIILAIIPVLYAKLSGLNILDYLKRIWLFIPMFVLVISIPAASNLFVKGDALFYIVNPNTIWMRQGIYFSASGIEVVARLFLRSGISLSFGFLLLLTTRWSHLTRSLAVMRVPLIFISILNMAYRYIFVISNMANDMIEARYLRTIGDLKASENRKFMGHSGAHLFIKSHFLSEEVFDAMRCRGFTDEPVSMSSFKLTLADLIFIINNCLIILILFIGVTLI